MQTQEDIEIMFETLKIATIDFWKASKLEDEAKIQKIAAYKQLQLARQAVQSITFER